MNERWFHLSSSNIMTATGMVVEVFCKNADQDVALF